MRLLIFTGPIKLYHERVQWKWNTGVRLRLSTQQLFLSPGLHATEHQPILIIIEMCHGIFSQINTHVHTIICIKRKEGFRPTGFRGCTLCMSTCACISYDLAYNPNSPRKPYVYYEIRQPLMMTWQWKPWRCADFREEGQKVRATWIESKQVLRGGKKFSTRPPDMRNTRS